MQQESFRKVHDLGATLLQRADSSAAQEIKVVTAQLQNSWMEVGFLNFVCLSACLIFCLSVSLSA